MSRGNLIRWGLGAAVLILLLVAPVGLSENPYLMHLAITGFYYAILASSWSLLAGYAGQFSFGHMGFMAIGAYTAALFGYYVLLDHRHPPTSVENGLRAAKLAGPAQPPGGHQQQ